MDKNIQKRIQTAVDALCDGNKSEFCRRIDRPAQAIKDIIGGKNSAPGYELIYDILSSDLGISPNWLILGKGPMLSVPRMETPPPVHHQLPLIPIDALSKLDQPFCDSEKPEDLYTITEFNNSDFLIRVKGDSMAPKYNGGDLLACKSVPEVYFQWGRVYVLCSKSQGIMVKRVLPSENEASIKCVSDNPKYPPFDMPKDDLLSVALVNGAITLD
jgi:SOS-response transcriptional repressor LexA